MINSADITIILPEIIIFSASLIALMAGVFIKDSKESSKEIGSKSFNFCFWLIFTASIFALLALFNPSARSGEEGLFGGHFTNGKFEVLLKAILLFTFLFALLNLKIKKSPRLQFEQPILMALAVLGGMFVISAGSFFTFYMGLEILSIASYIIVTSSVGNYYQLISAEEIEEGGGKNALEASHKLGLPAESGLKYFVLGSLASGLILFGISLIYGFSGSAYFSDLGQFASGADVLTNIGFLTGLIIFLCGFFFKLSAVPFHMWAPDVYEGAPKIAVSFVGSCSKIVAVAFLLSLFLIENFISLNDGLSQIFILVALLSIALGAFAGLRQKNIKRLFAYSSISHIGFILLGFTGLSYGNLEIGSSTIILYVLVYALLTVGSFACLLVLDFHRKSEEYCLVSDFAGIAKLNPAFGVAFSIILFSLAGIPPMAGFFIKFFVLEIAVNNGLIIPAIVAVLFSVVSAFYYLNIIKVMWFDEPKKRTTEEEQSIKQINIYARFVIWFISLFNLLFFIFAGNILKFINQIHLS